MTVPEADGPVFEKLCKGLAVRCVGIVTDAHDHLRIDGFRKTGLWICLVLIWKMRLTNCLER